MKKVLIIFVLFLTIQQVQAQQTNNYSLFEKTATIQIDSTVATYNLPDSFLIQQSEIVQIDSLRLLDSIDYQMDYLHGKITFSKTIPAETKITVRYQILTLNLQTKYFNRRLIFFQSADSAKKTGTISPGLKPSQPSVPSTLKQNGSIVRGISIGTNQGMKLESGLNMQVSGKIGEKVEVVAALTDQNTPIQPEGNTQSLQEIDKVFVQIKSDRLQATLGDYYFDLVGTEFSPYNRKLQGVMGAAEFGRTKLTLSGAVSKGKFITKQMMGQEGNQGPYQLTGEHGQIDIIVLAGTEKIWIDGELMIRGEDNDYIIEYSNGQITFTRNRLITSDSRITVDYQYSDQKFQRSLYSADLASSIFKKKLNIGVRMLRESDNKDNPLEYTLSDENLARLQMAGDISDSAYVSGIRYVGPNKGFYVAVDSAAMKFYRYVGVDSGDYNISFSYFGTNLGDYKFVGYNHYQFVGAGNGSYKPVVQLTAAQSQNLLDISLTYSPYKNISLTSELAMSQLDKNLYSSLDDGNNTGVATSSGFRINPDSLIVLGQNLGQINFSGKYRRVQPNFNYMSRTDDVEKSRKWDIEDATMNEEEIVEFTGRYSPAKAIALTGNWGENNKGNYFKSKRWQAGTDLQFKILPKINYQIESIQSQNPSSKRYGTWLRQHGFSEYTIWKLKPTFDYLAEEKKENYQDTFKLGFCYYQISPKLNLIEWQHMTISAGVSKRVQDIYSQFGFKKESEAQTQELSWELKNWNNLSLAAQYTHRKRTYADASIGTKLTDLADFKANYSTLKNAVSTGWHYQLSNTQVAKQEKIYLKVEQGQGNFRFDESLNEYIPEDLTGDYILRVQATDEFVPVVELRASSTIKLQPASILRSSKNSSDWKKWLSAISTETFVRLEEKTQDKDVWAIYRLELSRFQREQTTIYGTKNLRQDVYLNQNKSIFSVRLRYNLQNNLNNQYLEGGQRFNSDEKSIRIKQQLSRKVSLQIDAQNRHEEKRYKISGRSDKDILSNEISLDLSYRPQQQFELAIISKWAHSQNRAVNPIEVNFLSLTPRINYSFRGKGKLRAELEFNKVDVAPKNSIVPYEMVSGFRGGSNLRWLTSFDYNVSRFIRASVSWNGRYEQYLGQPIYTVRAEMRAYF